MLHALPRGTALPAPQGSAQHPETQSSLNPMLRVFMEVSYLGAGVTDEIICPWVVIHLLPLSLPRRSAAGLKIQTL